MNSKRWAAKVAQQKAGRPDHVTVLSEVFLPPPPSASSLDEYSKLNKYMEISYYSVLVQIAQESAEETKLYLETFEKRSNRSSSCNKSTSLRS